MNSLTIIKYPQLLLLLQHYSGCIFLIESVEDRNHGLENCCARLVLLDVLLWNVPPQILVGDALWCLGQRQTRMVKGMEETSASQTVRVSF